MKLGNKIIISLVILLVLLFGMSYILAAENDEPVPILSTTQNCTAAPQWSDAVAYEPESLVQHKNILYENKWYSQNNDPELNSGDLDVWKIIGACDSNATPVPTSEVTSEPGEDCSYLEEWSASVIYEEPGNKVKYNNRIYQNN